MKPLAKLSTGKNPNQLRIIGGHWRGRKLRFPDVEGLRPTGDRIRETLFNWLAPELQDARCLDLFAGSGALGLEALSRGATTSWMLERNALAASCLRENLQVLAANGGLVQQMDSLTLLRQGNTDAPFDVVFIDPPFELNLWQESIDVLEAGGWLADTASIYIEATLDASYQPPVNWALHRDKRAGRVNYRLYYREAPDN